jgi:hypothetical protein
MARIKYYDARTESWQYADEFGTAGLTPYGIGAIPAPEIAEAGQTIVVKAVDETGKPTEWEAADLPEGVTDEQIKNAVDAYLTENPQSGLNDWKLLHEDELKEEVSWIVVNKDSTGKSFNVNNLRIELWTIANVESGANGTVYFQVDGVKGYSLYNLSNAVIPGEVVSSWIEIENDDSLPMRIDKWYGQCRGNHNHITYAPYGGFTYPIKQIGIGSNSATKPGVGTKYRIYYK